MATNYASLLSNFCLYSYESEFRQKIIKDQKSGEP
jgi:hypothetical protein